MTNTPERRLAPRIDINGGISYQTTSSNGICHGQLENLSTGGARIWVAEPLPTDSELVFCVGAEESSEDNISFKATLLHQLPERRQSMYGYGCRIEESGDWAESPAEPLTVQFKGDA